jgi:hypothetical protein
MAAGNSLRLEQFGLQGLDFLLQGGDQLLTGRCLRRTGDRRMADFGEIDLHKRLAVVGTGTRPPVSFYQSPGSLRGNFEPFTQVGVRQHFDGHSIRSRLAGRSPPGRKRMVPIHG